MLGNKCDYSIVNGKMLSGKTTVANFMASQLGFKLISMPAIEEELKKKLGTEDEPVEDVPIPTIYQEILQMIDNDKKAGIKVPYLFDGYKFKTNEEILEFFGKLGPPDYIITCDTDEHNIKTRYKAKNETEEVGEEQEE